MGDVTVAAFGVAALAALILAVIGAVRRNRALLVTAGALLLGLAGAWTLGLPGAAIGVVALVLLKRRRTEGP